MNNKKQSPAFSFKWTWKKIALWAFYAWLSWIVAYLTQVVPTMNFWEQCTPIVIAVSLFIANSIKEYIKESK